MKTSTEWKPIDTAPKDGTAILVHGPTCYEIGHWEPNFHFVKYENDEPVHLGAWTNGYCDSSEDPIELFPSAWTPLPDPPTT